MECAETALFSLADATASVPLPRRGETNNTDLQLHLLIVSSRCPAAIRRHATICLSSVRVAAVGLRRLISEFTAVSLRVRGSSVLQQLYARGRQPQDLNGSLGARNASSQKRVDSDIDSCHFRFDNVINDNLATCSFGESARRRPLALRQFFCHQYCAVWKYSPLFDFVELGD